VSEWLLLLDAICEQFFNNIMTEQIADDDDDEDADDVLFISNQYINVLKLNFYSATLLKQQSSGRHVVTLRHIILIPSQPVFTPLLCNLWFYCDINPQSTALRASMPTIIPQIWIGQGENNVYF
jgi:hypothetical protein